MKIVQNPLKANRQVMDLQQAIVDEVVAGPLIRGFTRKVRRTCGKCRCVEDPQFLHEQVQYGYHDDKAHLVGLRRDQEAPVRDAITRYRKVMRLVRDLAALWKPRVVAKPKARKRWDWKKALREQLVKKIKPGGRE